jgi:prepilin signal peptidase PulO-like enzyme (type II secretory pathway)
MLFSNMVLASKGFIPVLRMQAVNVFGTDLQPIIDTVGETIGVDPSWVSAGLGALVTLGVLALIQWAIKIKNKRKTGYVRSR